MPLAPFCEAARRKDFHAHPAVSNTDGTPRIGSSGSNSGGCVSIYAPGDSISFASHKGATTYGIGSDTSFASPQAAALAARYIEKQIATRGIRPTYAQVYDFVLNLAQTSVVTTTTPPSS
jgi:Subtilase family.